MDQVQAALGQRLAIDGVFKLLVLVDKEIGAGPISLVPTEVIVLMVESHVMLLQEKLRHWLHLLIPCLISLLILLRKLAEECFFRERHFPLRRLGLHHELAG